MRNFINIATKLTESVEFHPAELSVEKRDGKEVKTIDYAGGGIRREMRPCFLCAARGESPKGCGYCKGTGEAMEEVVKCPTMRINYMGIELLCHMLDQPFDDHGWIPFEELPALKDRIVDVMTRRDKSEFTRPATDEGGVATVDWDGTTQGGARMVGPAVTSDLVQAGAERILNIINWALEHKTGVSWA